MSLIDSLVDRCFRDDEAGAVVVFPGDRRNRGYVVRSASEETKIRSFLKMFYFAYVSLFLLGCLLASDWSTGLNHKLGRPECHFLRSLGVSIGVYLLVLGIPFSLLWRTYKKTFPGLVLAQDEVLVSGKGARRTPWMIVGVIAFGTVILGAAVLYLIGRK